MAGLWDASTRADGSGIEPCAVITVPANAVMNVIDGTAESNEGRMPRILAKEEQEVWPHGTPTEAFACLVPYSDGLTIAHLVSKMIWHGCVRWSRRCSKKEKRREHAGRIG